MFELSDLIGFDYYLSDTQDGLKCYRMRFIFCGKHLLLLTRIQIHVSDPGPMDPLVYHNIQFSRETEKSSVFLEQLSMKIYSLSINMTKHNLIEWSTQDYVTSNDPRS